MNKRLLNMFLALCLVETAQPVSAMPETEKTVADSAKIDEHEVDVNGVRKT
jgi:hypothetical protein